LRVLCGDAGHGRSLAEKGTVDAIRRHRAWTDAASPQ
jgi:hypothetical protein